MKILFEVEDRVRQDSTCVYFKKAFQKLADVTVVYPEMLPLIRPGIFDLHIRVDYGIHNPFPKDLKPSLYYAIDTHIDLQGRLDMAKQADFDYVFCAQKQGAKAVWHTKNVFWAPLACDPEVHKPKINLDKKYDICFIGNCQPFWQQRRVERLTKLFKEIPNFYFGNVFFNEMANKYSESKIVFNSAHSTDVNMRVFETLCSGSFLFTDKQDWEGLNINPDFQFGEYSDDKSMLDMAKYYLKYEYRREEIAKRGQEIALKYHTYDIRAKEILKQCGFC